MSEAIFMDDPTLGGTAATREFYDKKGWTRVDGKLVDQELFGIRNDGPIRQALSELRHERIRDALRSATTAGAAVNASGKLKLAEFGCGGTPATYLSDLCRHVTVVDFSRTGLAEAAGALRDAGVANFETVTADMCNLPFADESFDAVFSAHAIYHIDNAPSQAKAFGEIMRVARRGGVGVFVLSNPFPLMFPLRMARRVAAAIPGVAALRRRLAPKPPLPYLPLRLGWMRRQLEQWGDVDIVAYRMASTEVNQNVSESGGVGRVVWQMMQRLETRHQRLAARLGSYVTIIVRKR